MQPVGDPFQPVDQRVGNSEGDAGWQYQYAVMGYGRDICERRVAQEGLECFSSGSEAVDKQYPIWVCGHNLVGRDPSDGGLDSESISGIGASRSLHEISGRHPRTNHERHSGHVRQDQHDGSVVQVSQSIGDLPAAFSHVVDDCLGRFLSSQGFSDCQNVVLGVFESVPGVGHRQNGNGRVLKVACQLRLLGMIR